MEGKTEWQTAGRTRCARLFFIFYISVLTDSTLPTAPLPPEHEKHAPYRVFFVFYAFTSPPLRPNTKIVPMLARFSCSGTSLPQTRKCDAGVAFSCLGCEKHPRPEERDHVVAFLMSRWWRVEERVEGHPRHEERDTGSCFHVWGSEVPEHENRANMGTILVFGRRGGEVKA